MNFCKFYCPSYTGFEQFFQARETNTNVTVKSNSFKNGATYATYPQWPNYFRSLTFLGWGEGLVTYEVSSALEKTTQVCFKKNIFQNYFLNKVLNITSKSNLFLPSQTEFYSFFLWEANVVIWRNNELILFSVTSWSRDIVSTFKNERKLKIRHFLLRFSPRLTIFFHSNFPSLPPFPRSLESAE